MTKESEEDSLFVIAEDVITSVGTGDIGPLAVDENNCAEGVEANDAPILLSGRMLNLRLEDMVELCRQGIAIGDDKNPARENFHRQGETTTGTGNWRRESIICPWKDGNLQNYFASFRDY